MSNIIAMIGISMVVITNTLVSQNMTSILTNNNCDSKYKTVLQLNNIEGLLFFSKKGNRKRYRISYSARKDVFYLSPCNLPEIKTNKDNIKIIFSGKVKEGNPAVKSLGSVIELTKLIIIPHT